MLSSTYMSLTIWNLESDLYSHSQLGANFTKIDQHDHSTGNGKQITSTGIANGAVGTNQIAASVELTTPELNSPILNGPIIEDGANVSGGATISGNVNLSGYLSVTGNISSAQYEVVTQGSGTGTLSSTIIANLSAGLYLLWFRATGTNIDHQIADLISVGSGTTASSISTLINVAYDNNPVLGVSMPNVYNYVPGSAAGNGAYVSGGNSGALTLSTTGGTAYTYVITRINASLI